MITLAMQPATMYDHDEVVRLLGERQHWLSERLSDQWQHKSHFADEMERHILAGETWIARYLDVVIATITVSEKPNARWSEEEQLQPALYVAKMATDPRYAGQGIGRWMIRWALEYAEGRGIFRLRWDAWSSNANLHAYYQSLGARHLRTVDREGDRYPIRSGALFELTREDARLDSTKAEDGPQVPQ